ncbi:protein of unknown function DUF1501 [Isosphaera pallida ATCC 43644]|uniref:Twin-arginine translocation pathway signal n=1 Tax=Isosphaera pallida (strain ATCC 43644 / DSM 9630 / IS1B) TaxID=575540 RepID=E8QWL6_ISOPI|nr:DUF1501 domain-containing protein [Isosphaera pallida]ADV61908.1 protein of unknown function DUF1501 [Isosphaera pallida ATCC 43644]
MMNNHVISHLDRRRFLSVAALTTTLPSFLARTGLAMQPDDEGTDPFSTWPNDRVLVVVQLAGGNDGLNTLIPYENDAYYQARPKLAIPASETLKLNDQLGLHPRMDDFLHLYDEGGLAILNNVGYPNPNRSHFRATEIWETAAPQPGGPTTGWIGRYFDHECRGMDSPMLGLQIGDRMAQTFEHPQPRAVTIPHPDLFTWPDEPTIAQGLRRLNNVQPTTNSTLDFIQRVSNQTLDLSRRIQHALANDSSSNDYLPFAFQQALRLVARMIVNRIPTRVYYVSLGGFDTHANQSIRHAALLQEVSQGLTAFRNDLLKSGHWDRTLVMTFSEFGRRVAENQSGGTDHGAANTMFMLGGKIRPGIYGGPPDLEHLDEGDLKHRLDFRSVYATILRDWLTTDPKAILGEDQPTLPLLTT